MTVLSLTWESPYLRKTVFILRWGPDPDQHFSDDHCHILPCSLAEPALANLPNLRHYWPRYPRSMLRHCTRQHRLKPHSLIWPSCWVEIWGFHRAGCATCCPNFAKLWLPRQCSLLTTAMCSTVDTKKLSGYYSMSTHQWAMHIT